MKTAILYIRVSTDEQAEKGYSQRNQDEVLQKYCSINQIAIQQIIYEDHSAKTFNRPEWKKMLTSIKKTKARQLSQLLLFTKWDRFSRNTADAYQMIAELRRLGVEPQAIEQPLDLSVPENKMMLAFYLAVPEVENDRRALNIMHGIRRAKKEGRWTGIAPAGYINRTTEWGDKYIRPEEPLASIMRNAFQQLATGECSVEQIWLHAKREGLRGVRQNFWNNIRNPVYCGKVIVPAYQDEPQQIVNGAHEALISEDLFDRVQLVLNRRRRLRPVKAGSEHQYVFRGLLNCPVCGRKLTASASKGRHNYYFYYHCTSACGIRFRTDEVEAQFCILLQSLQAKKTYLSIYREILKDVWRKSSFKLYQRREQLLTRQGALTQRKEKARDLLLNGGLEPEDYMHIKETANGEITQIQTELNGLPDPEQKLNDIIRHSESAIFDLAAIWLSSAIEDQSRLFRHLFPGNITFSKNEFSISKITPALRKIFR